MSSSRCAEHFQASLRTGVIDVFVERSVMAPSDLFGFAERRNPKRSFLFVSKVLGRHVPVPPAIMNATYEALADRIDPALPGPVLVIGMAETAVGLGAGVHRALAARRAGDCVYLATTRHPLGTPVLARFEEEHSHAPGHLLHEPIDPAIARMVREARSLVMVDDEASTGRTFANLRAALAESGLHALERTVLVTLTDWSGGRAAQALGAEDVSLLSGGFVWTPDPQATPPEMPRVDVVARGAYPLDPSRDRGRLGVVTHAPPAIVPAVSRGERVLVLGTGEHVWGPFLVAEALERAGAQVFFSACTRSPVSVGHAITSAIAFTDNYGLGIPNFLYNVRREDFDRIVLCTETPAEAVDESLVAALAPEILGETSICAETPSLAVAEELVR